ncbi:MAG: hypothetical protein GX369_06150 [Euryarchaeota archaeon]|nr:hypothetical protein [Euryarchaeota archaeon]
MMVWIELEDVVQLRIRMLLEIKPGLDIEYSIQEGNWALLTLKDGSRLIGFEFLESSDSWTRPDALLQYYEPADDGFYVGIIIPSSVLEDFKDMIFSIEEFPVTLLTYEDINIEGLVTV